jgi:hypothetical protein
MIIEIITIYVLLQCINVLARSVGRRRDVLDYLAESKRWLSGI